MEKLIKKLERYKAKILKRRALYIKGLAKVKDDVTKTLRQAYYNDEETREFALEMLHEYGISKEVEEDEDEHNTKKG